MKILQIVAHYLPAHSFGGVLQAAHALGKALIEQDCEVRVCTSNMMTHTENFRQPLNTLVLMDGVGVIYSEVKEKSFLRRWGFSIPMIRNLQQQIRWADVVILHFHYQYASWLGGLLCRFYRRPYIVCVHGSLNKQALMASGTRRKLLYLNWLEKRNFQRATFVAYQSEEEREASLQLGNSIFLPNGIDPTAFASRPPLGRLHEIYPQLAGHFVFLYLGRLDPNKGLDLLIPAFARLCRQHPACHLLLAGPDERGYQTQVEKMIRQWDVVDKVTLTGYISGETRLAILRDSNAFVLPSRYEGMSMSMLEALYNGLPVITTPNVGLWRRLEQEQCAIITPLDEQQLFAKMCYLVEQPARGKEMGIKGHKLVADHFNWTTLACSLHQQLVKVVSQYHTGTPG